MIMGGNPVGQFLILEHFSIDDLTIRQNTHKHRGFDKLASAGVLVLGLCSSPVDFHEFPWLMFNPDGDLVLNGIISVIFVELSVLVVATSLLLAVSAILLPK